jgi:hypothetical protein
MRPIPATYLEAVARRLAFLAIVAPVVMSLGCDRLDSLRGTKPVAVDASAETLSRFEIVCLECAASYNGCLKNKGVPGAIQVPAGETCESERESCMRRLTASDGGATGARFADCPP